MEILDIIKERHSVRQFINKQIENDKKTIIDSLVTDINKRTGLNIKVCYDEPNAFDTFMAHYGKFENVSNYIILLGNKNKDEEVGYEGERIILKLQELGLNSCWVALTYGKSKVKKNKSKNEKIYCVIPFGHGKTQGVPHKSKPIEKVSNYQENSNIPIWFKNGVEAALLAPTAMNQQKFKFIYQDKNVIAKAGVGFYSKIDLGIAKYHFELGAKQKINFIK